MTRLLLLLLTTLPLLAQEDGSPSATQIMQGVNDLMNQPAVYSQGRMIIQTSSGRERVFEMESWMVNGGEKTLMRYTAPSRVRGQSTLMLDHSNEIWIYFPRTNRVRKLASHARYQKVEGSDFTYEDMGSGDTFIEEFRSELLGRDKQCDTDCYHLELTRLPDSPSAYSSLQIWARTSDYLPLRIDYFFEDTPDRPAKRLFQSEISLISGIPTPARIEMYNLLDNTVTTMLTDSIDYQPALPDNLFTTRSLKSRH